MNNLPYLVLRRCYEGTRMVAKTFLMMHYTTIQNPLTCSLYSTLIINNTRSELASLAHFWHGMAQKEQRHFHKRHLLTNFIAHARTDEFNWKGSFIA